MKKVYIVPQTKAIEIFANQILMASGQGFILQYGNPGDGGAPR